MIKYFCDHCGKELKQKDIKKFTKTWDHFNFLDLCEKCNEKFNSKKNELEKEINKLRGEFLEKMKIKEKEILGDLK